MELEVGMYIRTGKGFIAKVKEFKHDYTKGKRLVDDYSVKEVIENYLSLDGNQCRLIESIDYSIPPCYPSDEELDEIKSHILKASHNIIDLIEVGDVITYKTDIGSIRVQDVHNSVVMAMIKNKEIEVLSIVTKEQFKAMEYRLGDK